MAPSNTDPATANAPTPLADWSIDGTRAFMDAVTHAGWERWAPDNAGDMALRVVVKSCPRPEADVISDVESYLEGFLGSAETMWEEPELLHNIHGHPLHDLYDEQMRDLVQKRSRIDQAASELGLTPPRSVPDLADYLVAAGVLCRTITDGTTFLVPAWPVLPPEDRFTLTDEELQTEDAARRQERYDATVDRITDLFDPDGNRKTTITTSLQNLAAAAETHLDEVRLAILTFQNTELFATDPTIATIAADATFQLTIRWETFERTR